MKPENGLEQLIVPLNADGSLDLESGNLLAAVEAHKRDLRIRARAAHTAVAYANDWAHFVAWCGLAPIQLKSLTSAGAVERTLLLYLSYYLHQPDPTTRLSPNTMDRRVAGIKASMLDLGLPFPTYPLSDSPFSAAINVARREYRTEARKATAIGQRLIVQMANACTGDEIGVRDRALLLLGFCGAFRVSEITGLDLRDVSFQDEGMVVRLRHSKTDQEGRGRDVYIPFGKHSHTCPVRALQKWIQIRGPWDGPLLPSYRRGDHMQRNRLTTPVVGRLIKKYASAVGAEGHYSAHSLRRGLATSAARAGVDQFIIRRQTGHKSIQSLEEYVQAGTGFRDNVMRYLDL